MDVLDLATRVLLGLGGLGSGVAMVMRQWRLRKRDHEAHMVRMRALDLGSKRKVLESLDG